MTTKETAIKFALWLREVDTIERAEEWFGFSDSDMFDCFLSLFPANEKTKDELISELLLRHPYNNVDKTFEM